MYLGVLSRLSIDHKPSSNCHAIRAAILYTYSQQWRVVKLQLKYKPDKLHTTEVTSHILSIVMQM